MGVGIDIGKRQIPASVPQATYSTIQINELIQHNIVLTNLIAEQLKYEESFKKN